jgi:hypothetical protein
MAASFPVYAYLAMFLGAAIGSSFVAVSYANARFG